MENKSDIKNMLRDAGILFVITLISGLVLGFVYELTKVPIRIQQELEIQKACQAVFAEADRFVITAYAPGEELEEELSDMGVSLGSAYLALDEQGKNMGFVVEAATSEGYGGSITLYLGITDDGKLNGISILEIAETPGLGMRADEVLTPQFKNVATDAFTYTKSGSRSDSEIDAISGATVTTEAIVNAANGGLKAFHEELKDMKFNIAVSEEGGKANE